MPSLAITGTIGSGKSELLRLLGSALGALTFSADDENRRLLDSDPEVREEIISMFGASCYQSDGKTDRAHLFALICSDPEARVSLEQIMHPKIERLWKPDAKKYAGADDPFFIAEIPLLFEKRLESSFSKIIVVGCSDSIRKERLIQRSLPPENADLWINLQESQQVKITKSDHLLWNDGSLRVLKSQSDLLASHLFKR